ncbi:dihydroorotase, partial [Mesorhizobium sp. M7D.F.Ca.US.004.03.1.1]
MTADLILRGTLVLGEGLLERGWVAVKDGTIVAIGASDPPGAREFFDSGDALIFPGIVDGQTHAGS